MKLQLLWGEKILKIKMKEKESFSLTVLLITVSECPLPAGFVSRDLIHGDSSIITMSYLPLIRLHTK